VDHQNPEETECQTFVRNKGSPVLNKTSFISSLPLWPALHREAAHALLLRNLQQHLCCVPGALLQVAPMRPRSLKMLEGKKEFIKEAMKG